MLFLRVQRGAVRHNMTRVLYVGGEPVKHKKNRLFRLICKYQRKDGSTFKSFD